MTLMHISYAFSVDFDSIVDFSALIIWNLLFSETQNAAAGDPHRGLMFVLQVDRVKTLRIFVFFGGQAYNW